jgi:hypothetical protein
MLFVNRISFVVLWIFYIDFKTRVDYGFSVKYANGGPGFLAVYDLASPPPPLLSASCLSFTIFLCFPGQLYQWPKAGRGVREEPNYTTPKKPGSL